MDYILVASFDIDKGSIMEHQYPGAISGDENMLAELMLPDQAHARKEDWTIFFLHKDPSEEGDLLEDDESQQVAKEGATQIEGPKPSTEDARELDSQGGEAPPLIYVLNLVNTKHDSTDKRCISYTGLGAEKVLTHAYRGAIVKAMAICTRHSFLHIYKVDCQNLPIKVVS